MYEIRLVATDPKQPSSEQQRQSRDDDPQDEHAEQQSANLVSISRRFWLHYRRNRQVASGNVAQAKSVTGWR